MKILFAASEATPLAKVGGLADVVGSLPKALTQLGEDVRLIMPKYGVIDEGKFPSTTVIESISVSIMRRTETARVKQTMLGKVPIYLVENTRYFGRASVYSENEDLERYLFFSKAVMEFLKVSDWRPEVIHCHDWHTGLIPLWVKKLGLPAATVFTIHNLAYQGPFDDRWLAASDLGSAADRWPKKAGTTDMTIMSQGVLNADVVSTVSETYAKEILTKQYGEGVEELLRLRQKDLVGIVNGIDYDEYNPETDPHLPFHYSASDLSGKAGNKAELQAKLKLPVNPKVPLVGMISRLDEQKGLDIIEKAAPGIMALDLQLAILGRGREKYHLFLSQLAPEYPAKLSVTLDFNNPLAHLIYAGSDLFLMPSSFEPCGLGQLIAMRYGAVPLVRHTGGLVDTVAPLSPDLSEGSGFVFKEYDSGVLLETVTTAVVAWQKHAAAWKKLSPRIMGLDFSWRASAAKYLAMYGKVLRKRRALP
ncbi:MAG: glycogen synthase [Chloroflexi bacterium]|nr:glycogen synthase [Chloroflexota bacterium]